MKHGHVSQKVYQGKRSLLSISLTYPNLSKHIGVMTIIFLQTNRVRARYRILCYNQYLRLHQKQNVMQIIVKDEEFTYSYDSSVNDKIIDGVLEEYNTPVEEAVDAALMLLWNVYERGDIARAIKGGHIPALDYDDEE